MSIGSTAGSGSARFLSKTDSECRPAAVRVAAALERIASSVCFAHPCGGWMDRRIAFRRKYSTIFLRSGSPSTYQSRGSSAGLKMRSSGSTAIATPRETATGWLLRSVIAADADLSMGLMLSLTGSGVCGSRVIRLSLDPQEEIPEGAWDTRATRQSDGQINLH